jgi:hypothetical protein
MLRTADDIILALRARKDELGLSNVVLEELAGVCAGHWDKACGVTRVRVPTLDTLMMFAGALGLAIQFLPDPDAKIARRWERRKEQRVHDNGRISKVAIKRARPIVLAESARRAASALWAGKTPEQRQAHIARMNIARAARRLARKSKAA